MILPNTQGCAGEVLFPLKGQPYWVAEEVVKYIQKLEASILGLSALIVQSKEKVNEQRPDR